MHHPILLPSTRSPRLRSRCSNILPARRGLPDTTQLRLARQVPNVTPPPPPSARLATSRPDPPDRSPPAHPSRTTQPLVGIAVFYASPPHARLRCTLPLRCPGLPLWPPLLHYRRRAWPPGLCLLSAHPAPGPAATDLIPPSTRPTALVPAAASPCQSTSLAPRTGKRAGDTPPQVSPKRPRTSPPPLAEHILTEPRRLVQVMTHFKRCDGRVHAALDDYIVSIQPRASAHGPDTLGSLVWVWWGQERRNSVLEIALVAEALGAERTYEGAGCAAEIVDLLPLPALYNPVRTL